MQPPFDIAADLDTPVSAWLKLRAFEPQFLLESVEGGERLARYSFLGFGAGPSLELYPDRLLINGAAASRPSTATDWSAVLRRVMNDAPDLLPRRSRDCRLQGGWSGHSVTTWSAITNGCRPTAQNLRVCPRPRWWRLRPFWYSTISPGGSRCCIRGPRRNVGNCARKSFTHCAEALTAGPLRAPLAADSRRRAASFEKAEFMDAVRRCKDYIAAGGHLPDRDVGAIRRRRRPGSLFLLPGRCGY